MSKERSKAHLDKIKNDKIGEAVSKRLEFQQIEKVIMRQRTSHTPHDLIRGDLKDIELAKKFWEEMLEAAKKFIAENQ